MRVEQLMTRQVVSCQPDDTLDRAAQLMWERDIGCVLVVDHVGKLVGMLTDRDACMAAYTQGVALARIKVSSAMAGTVWSCSPHTHCHDVETIMRTHQIRRVPVVDSNGKPVGVVTLNDLARAASSTPSAPINQREVETTLAAISMPRRAA